MAVDASGLRVAILDDYQGVARSFADWEAGVPGAEVVTFSDHVGEEELGERLAGFAVIVAMRERTPLPRAVIASLGGLRLIVTTGMRNAAIDLQAAADHGVVVCGTEAVAWPTVELTWGLILSLARCIPGEAASVASGGWQRSVGSDLHGKTLGILGLGRLGGRVASVGRAFGMEPVAWSPHLDSERAASQAVTALSKEELFARSDVLSIHMVLAESTRGLVGEAELAAMRPGAYLVNTSRGPLVDQGALIRALEAGRIAGAGLDVFDEEPLPPGHPLLRAPRTVLTPHLGYVSADNYRIFYGQALQDVQAFLQGAPVRELATPRAAPRSS
ncbi:MAG: D-2-hydroxyacid dehydrogenase family protein [Acidimicrobiales bacterium]